MSLRRPVNSVEMGLASLLAAMGVIVATALGSTAIVANEKTAAQFRAPSANATIQAQLAPPVSPLGARNDLPNPYLPGLSWGQLPGGRKWGSTAGIAVGPDGNIWAIDRCGAFGSRGTNCAESPLDPILKFDPSGKLLKSFGKGLFVSPHKITVDHDGNLWVADNGLKDGKGQQVFKFDQDGKERGSANLIARTRWRLIRKGGCSSATAKTIASKYSTRTAISSPSGSSSAGQAGFISIRTMCFTLPTRSRAKASRAMGTIRDAGAAFGSAARKTVP